MSDYAEVEVIVEGALDIAETFTTERQVSKFIDKVQAEARYDGLHTEVYVLWHQHGMTTEECGCAQYVTDHHPTYEWNAP
jgi:hypothetical protein